MYGKCAPLLSGISIEKIVGLLGLLYFDWGKVDGHCDLGVSLKFDVRGFFSGGIPFTYRCFFLQLHKVVFVLVLPYFAGKLLGYHL